MFQSSADIVIVGGGVVGASIAWQLAKRGATRIRILDGAAGPAEGSTGQATGGFRAQYGTAVNVQLSLLSLQQLATFEAETSHTSGYAPVGYLFMARSEATLAMLRTALAVQHAAGYPDGHLVSPDDIRRLSPAVNASQFIGGCFAARDGYINPCALLDGLLAAAAALGVTISFAQRVLAIHQQSGRISAVETATERINTSLVINAAGPWASSVARLAGVHLPVVPEKHLVAVSQPTSLLPVNTPMTIVADDGFHMRVRGDRLLLLRPDERYITHDFSTTFEEAWLPQIQSYASSVLPVLATVPLDRQASWAGLYEVSPDRHLIFGAAPECPTMLLANGSSGHGVMHSLAIGTLMAELILDGEARSIDMSPLAPDRFARGALLSDPARL